MGALHQAFFNLIINLYNLLSMASNVLCLVLESRLCEIRENICC